MIQRVSVGRGRINHDVRGYVVDSADHLVTIPLDHAGMGSFCFVIDDSQYYMLTGSKEWVKVDDIPYPWARLV